MNSPLAEIPPPAPRRVPRKPPIALSIAVVVGLVLVALDMVLTMAFPVRYMPEISKFWEDSLFFGATIIFYIVPLLLVWRGFNWARWLVIALSILSLATVFMTDNSVNLPPIREIVSWLYLPYHLALIVFLLTPAMKRHFTEAPAEAPKI